jgi:beta-mannosidase
LIWLFRDLWPGAGWGLIDANGLPKAAYYYVRRAMQPRAVFISDEGLNGLVLHVVNDHPAELRARLELTLWRGTATRVASGSTDIVAAPHGACQVSAATLFDHFIDTSNAYRFGPTVCDIAVASLHLENSQEALGYAHHFIGNLSLPMQAELGLTVTAERHPNGSAELCLAASSCLQSVTIDAPGFSPDDSYFHLSPGQEQHVLLTPHKPGAELRGSVRALNATSPTRIVISSGK